MVVTWVWWSPGYGGHLGMVITWVWWSLGYGGHLGRVLTWVRWSPGYGGHPGDYHTQITTTLRLGIPYSSFHSHLRCTSNLLPPALFSLLGFSLLPLCYLLPPPSSTLLHITMCGCVVSLLAQNVIHTPLQLPLASHHPTTNPPHNQPTLSPQPTLPITPT